MIIKELQIHIIGFNIVQHSTYEFIAGTFQILDRVFINLPKGRSGREYCYDAFHIGRQFFTVCMVIERRPFYKYEIIVFGNLRQVFQKAVFRQYFRRCIVTFCTSHEVCIGDGRHAGGAPELVHDITLVGKTELLQGGLGFKFSC